MRAMAGQDDICKCVRQRAGAGVTLRHVCTVLSLRHVGAFGQYTLFVDDRVSLSKVPRLEE